MTPEDENRLLKAENSALREQVTVLVKPVWYLEARLAGIHQLGSGSRLHCFAPSSTLFRVVIHDGLKGRTACLSGSQCMGSRRCSRASDSEV